MDHPDEGAAAARLCPGDDLTVWKAAEFKQALLQAVAGGGEVELDLAAVEEADLTTLQLLCSAHRTAHARGGRLRIGGVSPSLAALVEAGGFTRSEGCTEGCLWAPSPPAGGDEG